MSRILNQSNNPEILDKVAKLFKMGKKDKEIAKELNISVPIVVVCRLKRGLRRIRHFAGG
jgi:orotate phosphoribosyltransferase-like protein